MNSSGENKYYVYVYLDPRKPGKYVYGENREFVFEYEPFYVGQGHNNRYKDHLKESKTVLKNKLKQNNKTKKKFNWLKINKINKIIGQNTTPTIEFLNKNISEQESKCLEKQYIKLIGRKDLKNGSLTNLTDGGDGATGYIKSKWHINRIIEANVGKIPWNKGLTKETDERLKKISESKRGYKASVETRKKISDAVRKSNVHFGKKKSEETKEKIRLRAIGRKPSEKTKQLMSEQKKGEKNYNYEKKMSDEQKDKISKNKGKRVLQYDLEGNFIQEWNSAKWAAKNLNLIGNSIYFALKREYKVYAGYIWLYKNNDEIILKLDKIKLKTIINNKRYNERKINQYDLNYNFQKSFSSIMEAEKQTLILHQQIGRVCKRTRKTAGGYIWRYADDEHNEFKKH